MNTTLLIAKPRTLHTSTKGQSRPLAAPQHIWIAADNEYMKNNWHKKSCREIAEYIGCTIQAAKSRAKYLGLTMNPDKLFWNQERDHELSKLNSLGYAPEEIALRLKRTTTSIIIRMKRIGISRRFRQGWFTKNEAGSILGADHRLVQKWIDEGKLQASWRNGKKPCNLGAAMWQIKVDDLRVFILQYPEELQGRNLNIVEVAKLFRNQTPIYLYHPKIEKFELCKKGEECKNCQFYLTCHKGIKPQIESGLNDN